MLEVDYFASTQNRILLWPINHKLNIINAGMEVYYCDRQRHPKDPFARIYTGLVANNKLKW